MIQSRCPYCGHIQDVELAMVGQTIGCLSARCSRTFQAVPDRRHTGALSRVVFSGVILFAAVLLLAWTNPKWDLLTRWVEWIKP